ncbi:GNAT family N-acetyltransferase [Streptomyces hygroscopicus]|uniref:GNAT family N-acetyltransferase n=1 Tax=Streptomyces hygroscopicus TaxID=1912 RepID=UPI003CC82652
MAGSTSTTSVRGTLQSGTLGYTAYASTTGHGYMTEGLGLLIQHAFGELGLHRLEANIQPDNTPSLALVKRLGFEREGYSTAFQFINGEWRDHERWVRADPTDRARVPVGSGPGARLGWWSVGEVGAELRCAGGGDSR